ncbi:MAG: hypothetical protein WBL72_21915, partial [Thermoguttaceae bacterium]
RNGRFDPECDDRSKRKPRDSRAVKIEIDPLYAELRARLQAYRRVQKSMTLRNGQWHTRQSCFDG